VGLALPASVLVQDTNTYDVGTLKKRTVSIAYLMIDMGTAGTDHAPRVDDRRVQAI
jgi:hypothetical protein